jgi:hypothetical protein
MLPVARVIPLVPARARRLLNACLDDLITEAIEPMLGAPSVGEALAIVRRDLALTFPVAILLRRVFAHELSRNETLSAHLSDALGEASERLLALEPILGGPLATRLREIVAEIVEVQHRLVQVPDRPRLLREPAERMIEVELTATWVDLLLLAFVHAQERAAQRPPPPWLGELVENLAREHARYRALVESLLLAPLPPFGEVVAFPNWPPEVVARLPDLPTAIRADVAQRGCEPEVIDHLRRGLALLGGVAPEAPIEVEFDRHVAPLQFVLVGRVDAAPEALLALESELHRRWREEVGPRPFRHVLLQVKPCA